VVEKLQGGWGRDDLDYPVPGKGEPDEGADFRGGSGAADNGGQDTAGSAAGQDVTPICMANWSTSWRMPAGAVVCRSRTSWCTEGRPPVSAEAAALIERLATENSGYVQPEIMWNSLTVGQ
jgi:hypothetical protein